MTNADPSRRQLSLTVIAAGLGLLLAVAGVRFAILLRGGGGWIACRVGAGTGWSALIFWFLGSTTRGAAAVLLAPVMIAQLDQFARELPAAIEALRYRRSRSGQRQHGAAPRRV